MACARCGGFLVSEAWSSFVDNVRPMDLRNMTMCELWADRRFRDSRESSY
jgi:hypothetical protein